MNRDIFGKALRDFNNNNYSVLRPSSAQEDIITSTNISDEDILPVNYLFRDYRAMPEIEQKALQLCRGKVLDVGCGAGSHSIYLQSEGFDITAIDSSKGAIEVAKKRGVLNAHHTELLKFNDETFDTILLLMNGAGIFQELKQVNTYLEHLKSLFNPNGQLLIDSSDIRYMYQDDDTLTSNINTEALNTLNNGNYYGELDYFLSYKGEKETPMKWLYLDFETLKTACEFAGLQCEKVMDGEHYDYLAKLSV